MFEIERLPDIKNPIRKQKTSYFGEKYSYEYKVIVSKNKPYIIKVDFFDWDICVIKFYPKKYAEHPNKYKIRTGKDFKVFRDILTYTLKLCLKLHNENKDIGFAFFGEWDKKDVKRKNKQSQRQKIYLTLVFSKFEYNKNFIFYPTQENAQGMDNFLLILPKHRKDELPKIEARILKEYDWMLKEMVIPIEK